MRNSGVIATATLSRCALGIGGGRGVGCEITLTYSDKTRTWAYSGDVSQFQGLSSGDKIEMLVDPSDPDITYTTKDVRSNNNVNSIAFISVGLGCLIAGTIVGVITYKLFTLAGKTRKQQ